MIVLGRKPGGAGGGGAPSGPAGGVLAGTYPNPSFAVDPPGTQLSYVEFTAPVNVTATTEGAANTIVTAAAVAFDGSTAVWVEGYIPYIENGGGGLVRCVLYDGGSSIGEIGRLYTDFQGTLTLRRRLTPSAASHTYSIRAFRQFADGIAQAGAGGTGNLVPGYIRVITA